MPRPHKCRLIAAQSPLSAFKPAGVPGRELESIELGLDELEALRLADLEGLYQDAAAERMRISRPTFGRLLECARHKVACALFQSKMLLFAGGPVVMRGMRNFECGDCGNRFSEPYGTGRPKECPRCKGGNFCRAAEERSGRGADSKRGAEPGAGAGRGRCARRRAGWAKVMRSAGDASAPAGTSLTDVRNVEDKS
jgi:predicted DNA-binding protein (UPF0251 family)